MARDCLLGTNEIMTYSPVILIALVTIAVLLSGMVLQRIAMEILIERMGT